MSNWSMSSLKSLASFFYAGTRKRKGEMPWEPERAPMTVAEQDCVERALKAINRKENPVDAMRYISQEEEAFLHHLKKSFELNEDDLHLFYLVGYARHANELEKQRNPGQERAEMPQPEFSRHCLSLLMECVQSTLVSTRGYYAAMVYLKNHPVPKAWQPET